MLGKTRVEDVDLLIIDKGLKRAEVQRLSR